MSIENQLFHVRAFISTPFWRKISRYDSSFCFVLYIIIEAPPHPKIISKNYLNVHENIYFLTSVLIDKVLSNFEQNVLILMNSSNFLVSGNHYATSVPLWSSPWCSKKSSPQNLMPSFSNHRAIWWTKLTNGSQTLDTEAPNFHVFGEAAFMPENFPLQDFDN